MRPDREVLLSKEEVCIELVRLEWDILVDDVILFNGVIRTATNCLRWYIRGHGNEDITLNVT